jgi:hypothetical protein
MQLKRTLVIIGGGAAGFFAAINAAETHSNLNIIILEQGNDVLGKVKISGGGRCNVTHACFDVKELVKFYPRGTKELLSPFYQFNCEHTIEWFRNKNVSLKTETDGRMFPTSNQSQTIIDCLIDSCKLHNIQIIKQAKVLRFDVNENFTVYYNDKKIIADYLLIASGSSNTIWQLLKNIGHQIITPVPSLFTFNIKDNLIDGLEGISISNIQCYINDSKISTYGDILITHTGLSGPAILKLSAFGARYLYEKKYQFEIKINWIQQTLEDTITLLKEGKEHQAKKQLNNFNPFDLPHRFWLKIISINGILETKLVADLTKHEIQKIALTLTQTILKVHSKNTNKEEFVTAGGVSLKEVDFKTMESKIIPNLYFAGEVLDIDAVTGGFNFQAAWTTAYIAAKSIVQKIVD